MTSDDAAGSSQEGRTVPNNPPRSGERKAPRPDPAHYVLRVFYYNPDDPAAMVPMRWGRGFDLNYARWPGKAALIIVGALVIYTLISTFL